MCTPHYGNLPITPTVKDPITEMGVAHTIDFPTTYVLRNIVQNIELSPDITPPRNNMGQKCETQYEQKCDTVSETICDGLTDDETDRYVLLPFR